MRKGEEETRGGEIKGKKRRKKKRGEEVGLDVIVY